MILTILAEQSWTLHFSVTKRDRVKVNQNKYETFYLLIILLLIQLLNYLRLFSPTVSTQPTEWKLSPWHYLFNQNHFCIMAGVELAAAENGIRSQFIAQEEEGQQKISLHTSSQPMCEDESVNANLDAHFCNSQWVYWLQFTHTNNIYCCFFLQWQPARIMAVATNFSQASDQTLSGYLHISFTLSTSWYFKCLLISKCSWPTTPFIVTGKKIIQLKVTCYYFQKF